MSKIKKPLLFALALVPIAIVAGIFTAFYQIDIYDGEIMDEILAQIGSIELLVVVTAIQTVGYAVFCGFLGYILADKTGLWKKIRFEKNPLIITLGVSLILGIIFSLDYWTFGSIIDGIQESTASGLSFSAMMASVLYGGVIEEVMLRLFFMSLLVFIISRIFCKGKERIPRIVYLVANIISAVLFAAAHLPATAMLFENLTFPILFRCFLLNGGFGFVFGELYRRYGLMYSVISHAMCHIVCKIILMIFV